MNLSTNFISDLIHEICKITGIEKENLWICNKEECVDTRSTICYLLSKEGFSDNEISVMSGLSRQGVNKLRNGFYQRHKDKWRVREAFRVGVNTIKGIHN